MIPPSLRAKFARFAEEFVAPVGAAVLITQVAASPGRVQGRSMLPNLHDGERVVVVKYDTWLHRLGFGEYRRGDVLVFRAPAAADFQTPQQRFYLNRPYLIKRLIALPGDTVRIDHGVITVNGSQADDRATTNFWRDQGCWDTRSTTANAIREGQPGLVRKVTVPRGEYFVVGDNRSENGSEDSRSIGTIPGRLIAGRSTFVIWLLWRRPELGNACTLLGTDPSGTVTWNVRHVGSTVGNGR